MMKIPKSLSARLGPRCPPACQGSRRLLSGLLVVLSPREITARIFDRTVRLAAPARVELQAAR